MGEKKKKKIKLVSGMLCRDQRGTIEGAIVIFYQGCVRKDVVIKPHFPFWSLKGVNMGVKYYTIKEWEEFYDLKPPSPGRCFEIEIEL